jgi:hypothetical protein
MASNHFEPIPVAFASQTTKHQRTSSSEPTASPSKKTQLGEQFQPCNYSVVCGRGKHSFNHAGNRRFLILASMFVETYSEADSKADKSVIVSKILEVIRQAGGHFCNYESGAWFDVGDHCAREKVSALLRDLLHTQYRSSAKAKVDRRQETVRKQKPNQNQSSGQKLFEGTEDSDDSQRRRAGEGMCNVRTHRPARRRLKSKELKSQMTPQRRRRAGEGARIPWGSSIGWKSQMTSLTLMSFKF